MPEEILTSCWVVKLTPELLTLSVTSTTAANHIRYLKSAYLNELREQSFTFKQLRELNVVVTALPEKKPALMNQGFGSNPMSKLQKDNKHQGVSEKTRQTIAQASTLVTSDENLKKALLRLAESGGK